MRGLSIIVSGADPRRLHAALAVAAAHAALERSTSLFLQAEAVALVRRPVASADDERYSAAGLPRVGELLEEAIALGVRVTACQSGLALAGMTADELPEGTDTGGLVEMLARSDDHQLVIA